MGSVILLPGIYLSKMEKKYVHIKICTKVSIETLFTIAKARNTLNIPLKV